MADGGEQGGADAVALGERAGLLGLVDEALAVEYDGRLCGEGPENPAVLGGQHPAGQGEGHVVADGQVHVRVLRPFDRAGADDCRRGPGVDFAGAFQEGDRLHGEGFAQPLQEGVEGVLAAQDAAGEEGEDLGLGA